MSLHTLADGRQVKALRPPGTRTPCLTCPKIPAGAPATPDSAAEWGWRERRAYGHWCECEAVGRFPDDPVVRWHAAIFARARENVKAALDERRHREVLVVLSRRK